MLSSRSVEPRASSTFSSTWEIVIVVIFFGIVLAAIGTIFIVKLRQNRRRARRAAQRNAELGIEELPGGMSPQIDPGDTVSLVSPPASPGTPEKVLQYPESSRPPGRVRYYFPH